MSADHNHAQELQDLKAFFESATFPPLPITLNKYISIVSIEPFLTGEYRRIEAHKGSAVVLDSLFKHLRELKEIVQNQ